MLLRGIKMFHSCIISINKLGKIYKLWSIGIVWKKARKEAAHTKFYKQFLMKNHEWMNGYAPPPRKKKGFQRDDFFASVGCNIKNWPLFSLSMPVQVHVRLILLLHFFYYYLGYCILYKIILANLLVFFSRRTCSKRFFILVHLWAKCWAYSYIHKLKCIIIWHAFWNNVKTKSY